MMNKTEVFEMFGYTIVATLNPESPHINEYLGITVKFPKMPNPYSSGISSAIEEEAVKRFGKPNVKTVVMWGHDPSLTTEKQGRFDTVLEAQMDVLERRKRSPYWFGFVYMALDGSFDTLMHPEDRYVTSYIGKGAKLICVLNPQSDTFLPYSNNFDTIKTFESLFGNKGKS